MSPQSYRIVVDGRLGVRFSAAFDHMVQHQDGPNTVLSGDFVDQAHLRGLLDQISSLGITVTSFAITEKETP